MFQVKMFSSATHGGDIASLERAINSWLDASQLAIRQMTQSSDAGHIVVTFLYEKRRGEDQAHLATADVPDAFERDLDDTNLDPVEDEPPTLPDAELPY
jgi:hypothetical protein